MTAAADAELRAAMADALVDLLAQVGHKITELVAGLEVDYTSAAEHAFCRGMLTAADVLDEYAKSLQERLTP